MSGYSVAIRTLGTSGEKLRKTLEGVHAQTLKPERICIYIAEGYSRPDFTVGEEKYFWVRKGMMSQRILPYEEITSEYILMLDDDIYLPPDCVEVMLHEMVHYGYDCIGGDYYHNHAMRRYRRVFNILFNFACPFISDEWGIKIGKSGAFHYNLHPERRVYKAQSIMGGCALWKKNSFLSFNYKDELWLDNFKFSYKDDQLIYNKVYKNGGLLGIYFRDDIKHLDGSVASGEYRKSATRCKIRAKASFMVWWRSCFNLSNNRNIDKAWILTCFLSKEFLNQVGMIVASIRFGSISFFIQNLQGLYEGFKEVKSREFKSLGSYIITK